MDRVLADAAPFVPEQEPDNHRNAPRPDPACLYGLVGDIARAAGDTEANPFAVAANALTYLSCAVGRGPYLPVGNVWHHSRLFTLHVGRSGRGRKGDAVALMNRIDRAVRQMNEHAAPQVHRGGLSSREGLIFLIHDGFMEGKDQVPAIEDKRLWVIESEFANVLHQGKRDGNTLSSALRDCWDGVSMRPATKSNRLYANDPHVCLSGAITPSELRDLMASRELTNGFANRFLILWAERTRMIAFPRAASQEEVDSLADRILKVLDFCRAARWVEKDHMRVNLSPDAAKRYALLYIGELNANRDGERIAALVERRAPMLLRIAMLLALTDCTTRIEVHHIDAALAWVRYSVESVKFLFSSAEAEAQAVQTNEHAEKIVEFLGRHGRITRVDLSRRCFQGHASKDVIDAALDELLTATPPRIEVETQPRPKGSPGTPTKFYSLVRAKSENSANSEQRRGFQADSVEREVCDPCEVSEIQTPTLRTDRAVREALNSPPTRADIDGSHDSHNSQVVNE
ncbi:MAG: hypothetical protein C0453_01770 [Comamonadaceae bacterium]|nr:hypothetical protein [Comamonadaceae bacterium]